MVYPVANNYLPFILLYSMHILIYQKHKELSGNQDLNSWYKVWRESEEGEATKKPEHSPI